MKTFVKFCGLSDPAHVKEVPAGGAAGFVLEVPDSPRNITLDRATELIELVPAEAEAWAVVVQPSEDLLHRLFDEVGVDRIQVYGEVPPGLEFLEVHHLVPSVPVAASAAGSPDPTIPPAEDYPRIHIDSAGRPLPGGSGVRPDWEVCARIVDSHPGRKFVLAGGLTPQNVADALATVRPWGVDVSSGIESAPGVKDVEKMRAFVRAVEEFEHGHA
ncbi:MAG: phosphoribosylanthranilate isomerase [Thermoplasmata archaeon]|jgi:phosphoribosylanthranilate isomerase